MTSQQLSWPLRQCLLVALLCGCGSDHTLSIDDFLPQVPLPTGEPQGAWAGEITVDNPEELVPGPASTGMIGDFFLRNRHGRYVIEAPTRVIGPVPQGGNLVDAVRVGADGQDLIGDHFGELSLMYVLGRTCEHREIEVLRDGSGGGVAALRARGVAAANDFINLRGIGIFDVPPDVDPDIDDRVACATTYVLEPDASYLRVMWTLYNGDDTPVRGPVGVLADTGGEVYGWSPTRGFERLGFESLADLNNPAPVEYTLYQGPGVAYGILPRHPDPDLPNSTFLVSGVSVLIFGIDMLIGILDRDSYHLQLAPQTGLTFVVDVALGRDAADIEAMFRSGRGEAVAEISGRVSWLSGDVPGDARVGLYEDVDGDGAVSAQDVIISYATLDTSGRFSAHLPPGRYLARAEVANLARSETAIVDLGAAGAHDIDLVLPDPVYLDYSIEDEAGANIPARLTVIGRHPAYPDRRLFDTSDRGSGAVHVIHALRGTSVDIGDGADPRLALPAGSTYRILASRGTEWSVASHVVTVEPGAPDDYFELVLHRVAPADGYIGSEYHVHQIGSPDSPISNERRVASAVVEGVDLFASTDHDFVSDLQPTIETMGVAHLVRNIPGLEVTPFAYGHFNAWPLVPDLSSPNRGAIDWARGMAGHAMIPGEIFDALRARGARMIQVNHPRSNLGGSLGFLQYFDRAGLAFDYDQRQIVGDLASAPVPNSWLRLPEVSLWDDSFNGLEVWNRMGMGDTNGDGVREITGLDMVMRDWFNFLSFGLEITPFGNSDTHNAYRTPVGMPRTYVRVHDDSAEALASGEVVADLLDTLTGVAPRDVVVTNGPHIRVSLAEGSESVIGRVMDGTEGSVTLTVDIVAPDWALFDTLEIFANATPVVGSRVTVLEPLVCYTSRLLEDMAPNDVCALAPHGPHALDVRRVAVAEGAWRYEATAEVTLAAGDIVNHPQATDGDAWLVFRVRGDRAVFPLMLDSVVNEDSIDILVSGDDEERAAVLDGVGVPATAFTAPVYVDFDGGGYTAVLRPH